MRNHNNFMENLKFANRGEEKVAKILEETFKLEITEYKNNFEYDILCFNPETNDNITFEVKEDVRCKDTGNVVVEFESWGKPSGVEKSKADVWIFRLHGKNGISNLFLPLDTLKCLIKDKKYFKVKQMFHTDSKNKLYFFKRDVIEQHANYSEDD